MKYCKLMIEDLTIRLTDGLNDAFRSRCSSSNTSRTVKVAKTNIKVSIKSLSNLDVTVSGKNLKPIHQLRPIKGIYYYTVEFNKNCYLTEIIITIHKTKFKRFWYLITFKKYNPLIYNIRLERENLLD